MWPFSRLWGRARQRRRPRQWPFSVPFAAYEPEMRRVVREIYLGGVSDELVATEIVRQDIEDHASLRLIYTIECFLPWVGAHKDLRRCRILEIGCGTGSVTAALGLHAEALDSLDIAAASVEVARRRLELLQLDGRARFHLMPEDWIAAARRQAEHPAESLFSRTYDVIVLFATLEHMTIAERLDCLALAWALLAEGGVIVTHETPNRLFPYDWHTSLELFTQMLPDELALAFASRSGRADYARDFAGTGPWSESDRTRLYRWGRGVSYHEFELAIGLANLIVLDDGRNPRIARDYYDKIRFMDYVEANFRRFGTAVPIGFLTPSLDLILQKPRTAA